MELRILSVADFGLAGDAGVLTVGPSTADDLLAEHRPSITVQVPNRLVAGQRGQLECTLEFDALASFGPDAVVRALPALTDLAAARQQIEGALASGDTSLSGLFGTLPASVQESDVVADWKTPTGGSGKEADDRVSALLSQVEVPGEGPGAELVRARDEIDRRLTRQTALVLASPRLRSVEASWRGLAFLLERRGDAEIEVLSATPEDFLQTFFDQAFHREYERDGGTPLAAVVLGYGFDGSLSSSECLGHLAQMGESLRLPFLGSMGADYFGLKRLALLPNLPDLAGKSEGTEYIKWNALREAEGSLWLTLTMNRFLLRDATGSDDNGQAGLDTAGFQWIDEVAQRYVEPLWGEGSWVLGAILAAAAERAGLGLPMTAAELESMSCRPYGGRGDEPFAYPLEARWSDMKALELAECGLVGLVAEKGQDRVRAPYVPTYHRARSYTTAEATQASYRSATLPYQVFAGLASEPLAIAASEVRAGGGDTAIEEIFKRHFTAFLELGGGGAGSAADTDEEDHPPVEVEVGDDPEEPRLRQVTVRLRPRFAVCGGEVDLVLGVGVPA